MVWQSAITNSAKDALYISGYSLTMTPFSGKSTLGATIAAKYSLQTMNFIWIKAYSPYLCCYNSIVINKAEDTLVVVKYSATAFYIYIMDPQTGIEKYKLLIVSPFITYNLLNQFSQQILFAGSSRLYLTAYTNCDPYCDTYGQEFSLTIIDYKTGTFIDQIYSNQYLNSTNFGWGNIGIILDISSTPNVNGQEIILLGTSISQIQSQWYLGVLHYSASLNTLSGYQFDYNSGTYYYNSGCTKACSQVINLMTRVGNVLYATSQPQNWVSIIMNTVSVLTFSDSSMLTMTSVQVYKLTGNKFIQLKDIQYYNKQIHVLGINTYSYYTVIDFNTVLPNIKVIRMYLNFRAVSATFGNPSQTGTPSGLFNMLQGYYVGYQWIFAPPNTFQSFTSTYYTATIQTSLQSETCSTETIPLVTGWTLTLNTAQTLTPLSSLSFSTKSKTITSQTQSHFDYDLTKQIHIDNLCISGTGSYPTVTASSITFSDQQLQFGQTPSVSGTLSSSSSNVNWFYSVSTSNTTITIGDYVTINPTTNIITIRAKNIYGVNLAIGTYPVTVKYSLNPGFSTSFTFNLIINSSFPIATSLIQSSSTIVTACSTCLTQVLTCSQSIETSILLSNSNQNPTEQVYQIAMAQQNLQMIAFTVSGSTSCDQSNIVYSMTVTPTPASNFITFDSTTFSVSWQSNTQQDVDSYTIQIVGTVTNSVKAFTAVQTITLTVTCSCSASSDQITIRSGQSIPKNIKQNVYSTMVKQSFDLFLISGNKFCTQSDIQYYISVVPSPISTFITLTSDSKQNYISVQTDDPINVGNYTITITGSIVNNIQTNPQNNTGSINLVIQVILPQVQLPFLTVDQQQTNQSQINNNKTNKTKSNSTNSTQFNFFNYSTNNESNFSKPLLPKLQPDLKNPHFTTIKVNQFGVLQVFFSGQTIIPSNISVLNQTTLDLKIIPKDINRLKYLSFKWNVTAFTQQYFTLQIQFEKPLYVSSVGFKQMDQISVSFLDISLFTFMNIEQNSNQTNIILQTIIPQQFPSASVAKIIQQFSQNVGSCGTGFTVSSFVLNLFLAGSLTQIWSMIHSLQILTQIPYVNVYQQANVITFYETLEQIQKFSFIPTDWLFSLLPFLAQPDLKSVFQQLGIFFLILIGFGLMIILYFILNQVTRKVPLININFRLEQLYNYLQQNLFWNYTMRYILISYLPNIFIFLLVFYDGLNWQGGLNVAQSLFSLVFFIIYVTVPFIMTVLFVMKFKHFREKDFIIKYGGVTNDLSFRNKFSPLFILLFCLRRLSIAICNSILGDYPFVQIIVLSVSSLFTIQILGYLKPFRLPQQRKMEYFNEITMLFCFDHLYLFTDFVSDPVTRYQIGYSLIGVTLFNFVFNIFVAVKISVIDSFKKLKKLWSRYKYNQRMKKRTIIQQEAQQMIMRLNQEQSVLESQIKQVKIQNVKRQKLEYTANHLLQQKFQLRYDSQNFIQMPNQNNNYNYDDQVEEKSNSNYIEAKNKNQLTKLSRPKSIQLQIIKEEEIEQSQRDFELCQRPPVYPKLVFNAQKESQIVLGYYEDQQQVFDSQKRQYLSNNQISFESNPQIIYQQSSSLSSQKINNHPRLNDQKQHQKRFQFIDFTNLFDQQEYLRPNQRIRIPIQKIQVDQARKIQNFQKELHTDLIAPIQQGESKLKQIANDFKNFTIQSQIERQKYRLGKQ